MRENDTIGSRKWCQGFVLGVLGKNEYPITSFEGELASRAQTD